MHENPERIAQFRAEVAEMRVRDPSTGTDRLLGRLGLLGLIAGPACGAAAWFLSHGTRNPLQQRDAVVLALLGVSLAVVGAALWVKATLASFLRLWLARLSYEQAARADLVADAGYAGGGGAYGAPSHDGAHAGRTAPPRDPAVRG